MTHIGEPAFHLRAVAQLHFHKAQRTVCIGQAGAIGSIDANEELRHIGERKDADANDGYEGDGAEEHHARHRQCALRATEGPLQCGSVYTMNGLHGSMQETVGQQVEPLHTPARGRARFA